MSLDRIFQIVAAALAVAAIYFFFRGNIDGMFVSAVLGAVAFFLNIRFQARDRMRARQAEEDKNAPAAADDDKQ